MAVLSGVRMSEVARTQKAQVILGLLASLIVQVADFKSGSSVLLGLWLYLLPHVVVAELFEYKRKAGVQMGLTGVIKLEAIKLFLIVLGVVVLARLASPYWLSLVAGFIVAHVLGWLSLWVGRLLLVKD